MFKEVEDAWTKDSQGYDEIIQKQLSNPKDVSHWMSELEAVTGKEPCTILEIGCGPGFFSILLSRLGHKVKAIDGSSGMVACATKNFKAAGLEVECEEEDAVVLPNEENNKYDVIISRDVVWTLYDPQKAFARGKEVLKPNGKVIIYDGNYRRDRNSAARKAWELFSKLVQGISDRKLPEWTTHHKEKNVFGNLPMVTRERPKEDYRLLKEAGYKKVKVTADKFRNTPKRMEFWKYGYQGRKFRVIAWKGGRA